jgi:hypothetical protein
MARGNLALEPPDPRVYGGVVGARVLLMFPVLPTQPEKRDAEEWNRG